MRVPGAGICGPSTVGLGRGLGRWSRGNVTTGSAGCRALRGHDIYPSYGAGMQGYSIRRRGGDDPGPVLLPALPAAPPQTFPTRLPVASTSASAPASPNAAPPRATRVHSLRPPSRIAELVSLRLDQLDSQTPPSIRVMGKGRRERVLPLWKETATALNAWLKVRQARGAEEMFHNAGGRGMTRAGFEYILDKHVRTASKNQPSITKKRVTPHVLRHASAYYTTFPTLFILKTIGLGQARSGAVYGPRGPLSPVAVRPAMPSPSGRLSTEHTLPHASPVEYVLG
jgi:hypothetical protein